MDDRFEKEAEKLLPCTMIGACAPHRYGGPHVHPGCAASHRPAVAAKMRELADEYDGFIDEQVEHWRGEIADCDTALSRARDDHERLAALVVKYEALFPCGHRRCDWDDSYGECVACKIKALADNYDKLPLSIIEAHDKIVELEEQKEQWRVKFAESDIRCMKLEQNQHDENCDTMIHGKPCNCYLLIERKYQLALSRVAEAERKEGKL